VEALGGGFDAAAGTAGERRAGSVSCAARSEHRHEARAGAAGADDGAVYQDGSGRPPLPTRLMAGLAILKHTHNLSDEVVCELWLENPYHQYFCGEEFFQHLLPFDAPR
jgi:hypothetical protein